MNRLFSPEFWQALFLRAADWAITTIPSILLILVLAYVSLKVVKVFVRRSSLLMKNRLKNSKETDVSEMEKRIDTLFEIAGSAIRVIVWVLIGMLLLRKLGIDIAPLIAGAGIAGLAFGFGAQELVRDFISGFFMLLENQVRAGDVAIVNGTGGLVEHVGLRTIVLRDQSGVVHIFQNGKINTLSNMTKEWSAMVFDIGVAYKEDTDRVIEIMTRISEELRADQEFAPFILEPMEVFGVDSFGDSAVVIKARLKTRPIKQWVVGREYRRRLKKAFDNEGIEIPFPHRTVYWGEAIHPLKVESSGSAKN